MSMMSFIAPPLGQSPTELACTRSSVLAGNHVQSLRHQRCLHLRHQRGPSLRRQRALRLRSQGYQKGPRHCHRRGIRLKRLAIGNCPGYHSPSLRCVSDFDTGPLASTMLRPATPCRDPRVEKRLADNTCKPPESMTGKTITLHEPDGATGTDPSHLLMTLTGAAGGRSVTSTSTAMSAGNNINSHALAIISYSPETPLAGMMGSKVGPSVEHVPDRIGSRPPTYDLPGGKGLPAIKVTSRIEEPHSRYTDIETQKSPMQKPFLQDSGEHIRNTTWPGISTLYTLVCGLIMVSPSLTS